MSIDALKKDDQISKALSCAQGEIFAYDKTAPLIFYIEQSIHRFPQHVALEDTKTALTYAQLGTMIDQLSETLLEKGLVRGDKVGIYCSPSPEMVILIVSLVKIGVCYVPIDSSYPEERVNYIIEKSKLSLVVTDKTTDTNHPNIPIKQLALNIPSGLKDRKDLSAGHDPAYIIYTSGSTGKPKGAIVSQKAIANHMLWMQKQFGISQHDKVLLKTPIGFDPSVWEIFLPLFCGATLTIAPQGTHSNPKRMAELIKAHRITVVQLVPAILDELLKEKTIKDCPSLRYVFAGGENLKLSTKEKFFNTVGARLINLYGLTETTVDCTFYEITPFCRHWDTNCIGQPIYNTSVYILNEQLESCKEGEAGEIYISGDALSLGYFDNPKENESRFLSMRQLGSQRVYKTGDLGRWTMDGQIEFIGRNDEQIKINGVRFEPEEMIHSIIKHFPVSKAHIIKRENEAGYSGLLCFLVSENKGLKPDTVRHELAKNFPRYVIPKHFILVEDLPLTPNGKVDNRQLLKLFEEQHKPGQKKRPANTIEGKLESLWQETLDSSFDYANKDDFFNVGGDSLAALVLGTAIEKTFGVTVELDMFATYTTLESQVKLIKQLRRKKQIHQKAPASRHILCLKSTGNQAPIFLIHPIGGTVFWYKYLAEHMTSDRKIYAIQDPAIMDFDTRFQTIEEMALYYADSIRNICPDGPYVLGGASFGATVALEVAKVLSASNKPIEHILNFDGWALHPSELHDKGYFQNALVRQQDAWKNHFVMPNSCLKELDKLFEVQLQRLRMLYDYKIEPFPWQMTLFKAKKTMPIFQAIDEANNHWKQYAQRGLRTVNISGDHETMFQLPHVETLARDVDGALIVNLFSMSGTNTV